MPLNKVDMAFVVRQMCYMLLYAILRLIEKTQVGTYLRKEKKTEDRIMSVTKISIPSAVVIHYCAWYTYFRNGR